MNTCLNCGKEVNNKFCNTSCQNQYRSKQNRLKYDANPNTCKCCGKILEWEQRKNTYCSNRCATLTNNKLRESISDEIKQEISKTLKEYYSINNLYKKRTCKKCGKEFIRIKGKTTKLFCSKECSNYYKTHRNEFLSPEALLKISEGGRKSAKIQGDCRRSKNEIYFYELCIAHFENVSHNSCDFNGWDADVILSDLKIAILWNGPWHYKQIKNGTSLKQIQNRDCIKIKEIEKCGYTPYIIKDMGKHNPKFVEEEFEKFKKYIAGC